MTFAMSTEGDSVKSALSEANEKNATDNHNTDDSSQDSVKAKEQSKPVENHVYSEKNDKANNADNEEQDSDHHEDNEVKENTTDKSQDNKKNGEESKDDKEDSKMEVDENEKEDKEDKNDVKTKKEEKNKNVKENEKEDEKDSEKEEEEKEEEEGEDHEEAEEEEEEKKESKKPKEKTTGKGKKKDVPLLDQPLEKSGKRERKNVQKFEEEENKKEAQKIEFEEGKGTALGQIPRVEASITRFKNEDLKFLHRLLFKMAGNKQTQFKKNIRLFTGFAFEKDSDDHKKKIELLKKSEVKALKTTCEILDIAKTGNKDEIAERIMDFLMEPKDSGKPVGVSGRPKRASAVRANNRGYSSHDDYSDDDDKHASRSRRDKGKRANLKDETSSDEEFKPGNGSDASEEKPRVIVKRKRGRAKKTSSDEEEESLSDASSDFSDEPKSKRRKSITKPTPKGKGKGRGRGRPSKAASTPRTTKRRGRKAKDASSEEEEKEGSSSEDEPLAKKKSKSTEPPTDDEIKSFIKSVLDGANLEEITMKTVCQRVYDNYPDFDLTDRKTFIKSTVRSLIST